MVVLSHAYDIIRTNDCAIRLLQWLVLDPSALTHPPNLLRALFDPRLVRAHVLDWEQIARSLLTRVHREAAARPSDVRLRALINELLEYPDVPSSFRQADFTEPSEPTLAVKVRRGDVEMAFLTTVTSFDAPQNVTLQEIKIESYFPLDDATEEACSRLLAST